MAIVHNSKLAKIIWLRNKVLHLQSCYNSVIHLAKCVKWQWKWAYACILFENGFSYLPVACRRYGGKHIRSHADDIALFTHLVYHKRLETVHALKPKLKLAPTHHQNYREASTVTTVRAYNTYFGTALIFCAAAIRNPKLMLNFRRTP